VDNEFKPDIKPIRKTAEQKCIKALTQFHNHKWDRFRSKPQKGKRPRVPNKKATGACK